MLRSAILDIDSIIQFSHPIEMTCKWPSDKHNKRVQFKRITDLSGNEELIWAFNLDGKEIFNHKPLDSLKTRLQQMPHSDAYLKGLRIMLLSATVADIGLYWCNMTIFSDSYPSEKNRVNVRGKWDFS